MENNKLMTGIVFDEQSIVDTSRVFYAEGKVYRAIYDSNQALIYKNLVSSGILTEAFENGLVATKEATFTIPDCPLVLEHQCLNYFLHPAEMTNAMFWESAKTMIRIGKTLAIHGFILTDAHPWNLTFDKGKPVFFDFSSIAKGSSYTASWFNEFYTYFAFPLWLASTKRHHLAGEYRRQHLNGFGFSVAKSRLLKRIFFRDLFRLMKFLGDPVELFNRLENWVSSKRPLSSQGSWDSYEQAHNFAVDQPQTLKQKFVFDVLKTFKPRKVIDLAANKGYYTYMAEKLGAKVIAFDYESFSVDSGNSEGRGKQITFCLMDFKTPTPAYGWGLVGPDAFKRFRSDIAMALGLIHHICLTQRFPVKLFCDTCAKYSKQGVILEYVYPEDIHVASWNIPIPSDYSIAHVKGYFKTHFTDFRESEIFSENGSKRQFFYFYGAR